MTPPRLQRILLVDDDPDIRTVARMALEVVGGFDVSVCASGREAVTAGAAFQPDLILMDALMPDMDGTSTAKALRRLPETASTPIIFLTALTQTTELSLYRKLGAIDVIRKPFDPMTLADDLRHIWEREHE